MLYIIVIGPCYSLIGLSIPRWTAVISTGHILAPSRPVDSLVPRPAACVGLHVDGASDAVLSTALRFQERVTSLRVMSHRCWRPLVKLLCTQGRRSAFNTHIAVHLALSKRRTNAPQLQRLLLCLCIYRCCLSFSRTRKANSLRFCSQIDPPQGCGAWGRTC